MRRLLGNIEVARELGWTRQRVHVNYKRGNLPKPYALVGKKPVWQIINDTVMIDQNYYICNNKDCLCEEIHLDSIFQQ